MMPSIEDKPESKSLIQKSKVCYVCGSDKNLHRHHIFFGTANREKSEEDGMWLYLCGPHHNLSNAGVHFNKQLDDRLKTQAEKIWILYYAADLSREEQIKAFIKRYGRNYLDE